MELIYKRIDNFRELNEQAELYTLTQDALDCDARVQTLEHEVNRRHSLVGVAG